MKIKNILLIFNLLAALAAVVYYKIKTRKKSSYQTTEFIVGTAAQYAPWMSVNEKGEYEGFDKDVAQAISDKIGKTLVLKDLGSMTALFLALQEGSIDAIMWGISITQKRLEKVSMIHYSGDAVTSYPLLFWNGVPPAVKTMQDLKNMTISVESGSAQDSALSMYEFINKKAIEKVDDGLLDIQYAKSDAVLVEPAIAKKFLSKYPSLGVFEMPLSEEHKVFGVGVCIKKTNTALATLVQKAITELKKEGIIAEYEKKWEIV